MGITVFYKKDKKGKEPTQGYAYDFCHDIRASEGVLVPPLTFKSVKVGTGLYTDFDPTEVGMKVSLRSGVAYNTPLLMSNAPGIIEGNYRGELGILLRNSFIDSRLVDFAFNIKGERVKVKHIPLKVLERAERMYKEETDLLEYSDISPQVKEDLYSKLVPAGTVYIAEGDRIAQMHFQEKVNVTFKQVSELSSSNRGKGGFGSSGTK